jgi:hypothetical protein
MSMIVPKNRVSGPDHVQKQAFRDHTLSAEIIGQRQSVILAAIG